MARNFDEQFEATGYDESGWTETVGSGATVDEDNDSSDAGSPSGWDDQCLEVIAGDGINALAKQTSWSQGGDFYFRIEIVISSHGLTSNGDFAKICHVWDASWGDLFGLQLYQSGSDIRFRIQSYHDGTFNSYVGLSNVSTSTRYRLEVKWDSTNNVWAWRVGGTDQPNDQDASDPVESEGTLSGTHKTSTGILYVGPDSNGKALTAYIDNIAVDDADWVGEETSGVTIPILSHHYTKNIGSR